MMRLFFHSRRAMDDATTTTRRARTDAVSKEESRAEGSRVCTREGGGGMEGSRESAAVRVGGGENVGDRGVREAIWNGDGG